MIYPCNMDQQQVIEKHLKAGTARAYWIGAALGLLFGIIAGLAIGYSLGSDHVLVIPLDQGIET